MQISLAAAFINYGLRTVALPSNRSLARRMCNFRIETHHPTALQTYIFIEPAILLINLPTGAIKMTLILPLIGKN